MYVAWQRENQPITWNSGARPRSTFAITCCTWDACQPEPDLHEFTQVPTAALQRCTAHCLRQSSLVQSDMPAMPLSICQQSQAPHSDAFTADAASTGISSPAACAGDQAPAAQAVAAALGIPAQDVHSAVKPQGKAALVEQLQRQVGVMSSSATSRAPSM